MFSKRIVAAALLMVSGAALGIAASGCTCPCVCVFLKQQKSNMLLWFQHCVYVLSEATILEPRFTMVVESTQSVYGFNDNAIGLTYIHLLAVGPLFLG